MGQKMWGYCCALFVLISLASSVGADEAKKASNVASPGDAMRRIEAVLNQPLGSPLEFVETPLSQVAMIISEDYDIPIQFDTAALDAVATSPETEVSINIANVSLRSALELILSNAGAQELTYIIDKEVLMITTQEEAEKKLEVIVYRVDDLVRDDSPLVWSDDVDFDPLIDVIVATVEHESWMENGTGEGEIQPLPPGMLVVAQTRRVHDRIADLLQQIREAKREMNEKTSEQRAERANRPVLRSIAFHDEAIANCEKTRNLLSDVIRKSVNWDREAEGDELVLQVLPNRVLVRHVPEVVEEVNRVVRHVIPATQPSQGAHMCGGGTGGAAGGTTSSAGAAKTTPASASPDLADPSRAGEDKQVKP